MSSEDKKPATILEFRPIEDALGEPDMTVEVMEVPEWKTKLRFGSLNAEEMIEFVEANEGIAKRTASVRLVQKSLINEKLERIGDDKMLQRLMKKDAKIINRLASRLLVLNGLSEDEQKKLGNG